MTTRSLIVAVSLAVGLLVAAPVSAQTATPVAAPAPTKKPIIALVSTLGDQITYVRQKESTGSNIIDNNNRQIIKTPNNGLNKMVLRGLERATNETHPGSEYVYITLNPMELEGVLPQNREEVALGKLVTALEKIPERANWDKVIVATPKYLQSEYSGMGPKLHGFGVYVQPLESARLDGTDSPLDGVDLNAQNESQTATPSGKRARSKTYVAPFAYIQVWTLDAKTLRVISKNARHDFVKLSDPESAALRIEKQVTPEFLAARMDRLIERSVTMAAGGKDPNAVIDIGEIKVVTPEQVKAMEEKMKAAEPAKK
jgi:hypothetical protein